MRNSSTGFLLLWTDAATANFIKKNPPGPFSVVFHLPPLPCVTSSKDLPDQLLWEPLPEVLYSQHSGLVLRVSRALEQISWRISVSGRLREEDGNKQLGGGFSFAHPDLEDKLCPVASSIGVKAWLCLLWCSCWSHRLKNLGADIIPGWKIRACKRGKRAGVTVPTPRC